MNYKKLFIGILFLFLSMGVFSQSEGYKWTVGAGGSFIKFDPNSTVFPNETYNFQIPTLSLTRYIKNGFSAGISMTVGGIPKVGGVYENNFSLMSVDVFGRYDFKQSQKRFVPYAILSLSSLVRDFTDKASAVGLGAGATFWINNKIGVNGQAVYKYVPSKTPAVFESHTQVSLGLVYSFGKRAGSRGGSGHGFCSY